MGLDKNTYLHNCEVITKLGSIIRCCEIIVESESSKQKKKIISPYKHELSPPSPPAKGLY